MPGHPLGHESSWQVVAAGIGSCLHIKGLAGLGPVWPLTSLPPLTDSFPFMRIYDLILFFNSLSKVQLNLH